MDTQKIVNKGTQEGPSDRLKGVSTGLHGTISPYPYPTYQSGKIGLKKGVPLKKRSDPNKGNAAYLRALMKALGDDKKAWELMRDKK